MYRGSSIRLAAMAAMTLAGLAWAGGAQATIVDLGAAGSPINVSRIPGIASITFSPSPAADVVYTPDGTDFPNQGATHIAGFVQTFLGLSTTPTFEEQFWVSCRCWTDFQLSGVQYRGAASRIGRDCFRVCIEYYLFHRPRGGAARTATQRRLQ